MIDIILVVVLLNSMSSGSHSYSLMIGKENKDFMSISREDTHLFVLISNPSTGTHNYKTYNIYYTLY